MSAATMTPERVAHDMGYDPAERVLQGVDAAVDDCEAFSELQQGLLQLANLLAELRDTGQHAERDMMAGGFASVLALPLMRGMRAEAGDVLLRVSLQGKKP